MRALRRGVLSAVAAIGMLGGLGVTAQAEPATPAGLGSSEYSIGPAAEREAGENGTSLFPVYRAATDQADLEQGPDFFAYCIEMSVKARFDVDVELGAWSEFPGHNRFTENPEIQRKVGWIVNNSYPTVSLQDLRVRTGIKDLTAPQAIAGTQYAIWHFTDDSSTALSTNADLLRTHLTGRLNTGIDESAVAPWVDLTLREGANVLSDAPVGPFVVTGNREPISVSVSENLPVVDHAGNPIDQGRFTNESEFYLDASTRTVAGSATVTAQVRAAQHQGALLTVPSNDPKYSHSQTLILVTNRTAVSEASLEFEWEAPANLELRAPEHPIIDIFECVPGDSQVEIGIRPVPTEGITYQVPRGEFRPGETYSVIAVPDESTEIEAIPGWTMREDGSAEAKVTLPEVDCPPTPEPAPAPTPEPAPAPTPEPAPAPTPEPALPETGAANSSLILLAGGLLLAGTATLGVLRSNRSARFGDLYR